MAEQAPDDVPRAPHPEWWERFRIGDRQVLADIYQQQFFRVRKAVAQVLREPADQDNVVHQMFADLVESAKLRCAYAGGDMGAWLVAIARHKAIDFARRQSRLVAYNEHEDTSATDSDHAPLRDFRADLDRFAQTQPLERQRLLQLRFIAGLTQVEASDALCVPRSTLEAWEHQLKTELRRFLLDDPANGGGA